MRSDSPRARWAGLLLAMALLSTGCVSLTPPPGRGMNLRYMPRETAARPSVAGAVGGAVPRSTAEPARQSLLAVHLAFLGALGDVSSATRRISGELSRLKDSR